MNLLSRDSILEALQSLAEELVPATPPPVEIVIAGGAAVVLLYQARQTTRDVDAFPLTTIDPAALREAVRKVGLRHNLPEDWFNDGAKGYLHGLAPGEVVLERPSLIVRALAVQQLLAMKLCAWRDDIDIADARLLVSKLPGDAHRIWSLVEPHLIPGRELKARYAFEDLWESVHGSEGAGPGVTGL
jgi:hypothetical protein